LARRFLSHFHNVLFCVLIGAGVVTAFLEHWIDTTVILAVVVVNAIIGFIQEGRAEQAMDGPRLSEPARIVPDTGALAAVIRFPERRFPVLDRGCRAARAAVRAARSEILFSAS